MGCYLICACSFDLCAQNNYLLILCLTGSGGGTIAALNEADIEYQKRHPSQSPTVLICHAGGESSRCPSQITLGKAWTSLPVVSQEYDEDTGATYCSKVVNPTSLLIDSFSVFFGNVPKGSVVVAASDVLLSFGDMKQKKVIDFNNFAKESNNKVIGLAVPAPLSTAKNHGVFVLDSEYNNGLCEDSSICPTYRVLQKPSIDEMKGMTNPQCTFLQSDNSDTNNENQELLAWIDTGVVLFLPGAAETLRELSRTILKSCTQQGLTQMYEDSCGDGETQSLEEFANHTARKICLYSDILHSLKTTLEREEVPLSDEIMNSLHQSLSKLELFTCAIPNGSFIHLGTTSELLNFLTHGTSRMNDEKQIVKSRNALFGRSISLTRRACASINSFRLDNIQSSVILNTCISASVKSDNVIGSGCVVEHCDIQGDNENLLTVEIGERCLISGIRNIKGSFLRVPSGICLQLLSLTAARNSAFVCLCFGVDDDIKASPPNTLFGVDFQYFLRQCGLDSSDLWEDNIDKKMIWNAKIMLVVIEDEEMKVDLSFLEWIHAVVSAYMNAKKHDAPSTLQSHPALKRWKESRRLSISQLRQSINSEAEVLHRKAILLKRSLRNNPLLAISERRHEPCKLDHIVDFATNTASTNESIHICNFSEVRRILHELEALIWHHAEGGSYDIVGRSFMTMAMLLSDIHHSLNKSALNMVELDTSLDENVMLASLAGPFWSCSDSRSCILNIKHGMIGPYTLCEILSCCDFLEKAASAMVGRCVRGNASSCHLLPSTFPIGVGITAVASAPGESFFTSFFIQLSNLTVLDLRCEYLQHGLTCLVDGVILLPYHSSMVVQLHVLL